MGSTSMAAKRSTLSPCASSRRQSAAACCRGRVTRTPMPCSGSMRSGATQPLQQFAGARLEQAPRELLAEGCGAGAVTGYALAQQPRSVGLRDQTLERETVSLDAGEGGERRLATAAQRSRKGALCRQRGVSGGIIECSHERARARIVATALDADRSLTYCRQHRRGGETGCDVRLEPEADEAGTGEDDGVQGAVLEAREARVDVAAQRLDAQVGPYGQDLRLAPQARGTELRARGQVGEGAAATAEQRVARIGAREKRGDHEALRHLCRHVLHGVDRDVGASLGERSLELLDEQTLAADGREAPVLDPIALRRHR